MLGRLLVLAIAEPVPSANPVTVEALLRDDPRFTDLLLLMNLEP